MQAVHLLLWWLAFSIFTAEGARAESNELVSVPLCRALERLESGDQIPVVVSGIYAVDILYDPEERNCRLAVDPSVCIEFASDLERSPEFIALHKKFLRVYATFSGVLHGRQLDPQINDPMIPVAARIGAVNSARYCANRYRAKLVVDGILNFSKVPKRVPWEPSSREVTNEAFPSKIALPSYPKAAISLEAEGSVLINVTVSDGVVTDTRVQFGDPVLVKEAVANVRTWSFAPNLNFNFAVEYEFQLEKRTASKGTNPEFEMRLPTYVKIIGARNGW